MLCLRRMRGASLPPVWVRECLIHFGVCRMHSALLPSVYALATCALVAWMAAAAAVDARSRGFPHALDSVLYTLHIKEQRVRR